MPTASMSDVAFLLLIFFLTTTKFDIKKGLGLVLPPASQQGDNTQKVKIKDDNITKIQISREGLVMVNKEQVPMDNIALIRKYQGKKVPIVEVFNNGKLLSFVADVVKKS